MIRTTARLGLSVALCAAAGQSPSAQQRPVFRTDVNFVTVDAAAPLLGVPSVFRATPSPRSPLEPVTAPVFRRNERIHIEWPVAHVLTARSARVLGRTGEPLAVPVALAEREGPSGGILMADAVLGALAPGDYLIEVSVTSTGGTRIALIAFRVVP